MKIRRSQERGSARFGWLDTRHTFSFGQYHDPEWMGFGALRVLNDDVIGAGGGFDPHPHRDMEIVSYVTAGALEHRDSMGHASVLRAGQLQRMSAGSGIMHSEYNASQTEPMHLFQIWILPREAGIAPEYEELHLDAAPERDGWRLLASPDFGDGAMTLHQDARILQGSLPDGGTLRHELPEGRRLWAHVARGEVAIGEATLTTGDAAGIEEPGAVTFTLAPEAEVLLFEV